MSGATKCLPQVSRQDALDFLGNACRNWTLLPPLSNDDADDVAGALNSFLKARGVSELYEALQNAIEALAMCAPSTQHGAACHSAAMLGGRAALAKARGEA